MQNGPDQRGAGNIAVRVGSALADASSKGTASTETRPTTSLGIYWRAVVLDRRFESAEADEDVRPPEDSQAPRRTLRSATLLRRHFCLRNLAIYALSILCLYLLGTPASADPVPLPGTQLLPPGGDLDSQMLDGIDRFLDRHTEAFPIGRHFGSATRRPRRPTFSRSRQTAGGWRPCSASLIHASDLARPS